MAARSYSSMTEVLELLENEELLNDELESKINLVNLDVESVDDDTPQGDGIDASGSTVLLPNEYLDTDCIPFLTTAIGNPTPVEKDSLLYSDTEDEFSSEEGK